MLSGSWLGTTRKGPVIHFRRWVANSETTWPNPPARAVVPEAKKCAGDSVAPKRETSWVPPIPLTDAVSIATVVLAHTSGFTWDEALLVMLPIAVIGGILVLANSRARAIEDDRRATEHPDESATTHSAPDTAPTD